MISESLLFKAALGKIAVSSNVYLTSNWSISIFREFELDLENNKPIQTY